MVRRGRGVGGREAGREVEGAGDKEDAERRNNRTNMLSTSEKV